MGWRPCVLSSSFGTFQEGAAIVPAGLISSALLQKRVATGNLQAKRILGMTRIVNQDDVLRQTGMDAGLRRSSPCLVRSRAPKKGSSSRR